MQEVRHDGSVGPIVPFVEEQMRLMLEKPEVKEVRVFNLQKGMQVEVDGFVYTVAKIKKKANRVVLKLAEPLRG